MSEVTWPRAVVLALAVAFLGFSLALFLERDRPPSSSSVDVGFYQDMVYHHDQAVQMAIILLDLDGVDSTVRHYAREVLTDQSFEIGVMTSSLDEWGFSADDRPDEAMEWMAMPVPVDEMAGLMTEEQMDDLENASGEEANALFLEMMSEHHLGGIHMAEHAAEHAESDHVRETARRMAHNQAREVNMYALLAERLELPLEIDLVPVPSLD